MVHMLIIDTYFADTMTNKGNIMPLTRHGINKSDRGSC